MKRLVFLLLPMLVLGAGCVPIPHQGETASIPPAATPQEQQRPAAGDPASDSVLDWSGRGLTAIPSDVFSKTNLEQLDLSNNHLTGAPQAEIRHLQKLKTLNLSDNQLTGLPAELGQLKKLEVLDVSNNRLTGLPLELGDLTQLRVLDISGNQYSAQDLNQIAAKLPNTEIKR